MNVMKLADMKRNAGGANMKKRLFSILLCIAMVLSLLPTMALAAEEGGVVLTASTTALTSGTYTVSADLTLTKPLTVAAGRT